MCDYEQALAYFSAHPITTGYERALGIYFSEEAWNEWVKTNPSINERPRVFPGVIVIPPAESVVQVIADPGIEEEYHHVPVRPPPSYSSITGYEENKLANGGQQNFDLLVASAAFPRVHDLTGHTGNVFMPAGAFGKCKRGAGGVIEGCAYLDMLTAEDAQRYFVDKKPKYQTRRLSVRQSFPSVWVNVGGQDNRIFFDDVSYARYQETEAKPEGQGIHFLPVKEGEDLHPGLFQVPRPAPGSPSLVATRDAELDKIVSYQGLPVKVYSPYTGIQGWEKLVETYGENFGLVGPTIIAELVHEHTPFTGPMLVGASSPDGSDCYKVGPAIVGSKFAWGYFPVSEESLETNEELDEDGDSSMDPDEADAASQVENLADS